MTRRSHPTGQVSNFYPYLGDRIYLDAGRYARQHAEQNRRAQIFVGSYCRPRRVDTGTELGRGLKVGHYALDEHGKLKHDFKDIIALLKDRDVPMYFGHASHAEIYAYAEECNRIGHTPAR